MNANFTQYVDPIFMRVLDLLLFIKEGGRPSVSEQKRIISEEIDAAERELGYHDAKTWDLAKYAMVAWIDAELSSAVNWDEEERRKIEGQESLEWAHFRSNDRYQKFYLRAREATEASAHSDALETYYLCVMLGFRGLYGEEDPDRLKGLVGEYGLPATLSEWAGEVGNTILQRRQRKLKEVEATAVERTITTARALWKRHRVWWGWLCALLLLMGYVIYRYFRPYY